MVKVVPVSLRSAVDPEVLCRENPCDETHILGSYWPSSKKSFESHVVKVFKACCPVSAYQPHITNLCEFYAEKILSLIGSNKPDWVARVLSSAEEQPEGQRPMSLLAEIIRKQAGAGDLINIFYKSEPRDSMRYVSHLSGAYALKNRVRYASQDLFIKPANAGGYILLLDDIFNTGASVRVYAHALKEYADAERVVSVNLAATRFNKGKDGHGLLRLETDNLADYPKLEKIWADKSGVLHSNEGCESINPPAYPQMRFIAEKECSLCEKCGTGAKPGRKWWRIFC